MSLPRSLVPCLLLCAHCGQPQESAYTVDVTTPASAASAWTRRVGGAGEDTITGSAVDCRGDAVVTGSFHGTIRLGRHTLTSAGGADILVAKFAPDGAVRWAVRLGGPNDDLAHAVTTDPSGNVIVSGGRGHAADSATDVYLAKLSPAGDLRWERTLTTGDGRAYSLAVDSHGRVVTVGSFSGGFTTPDGVMPSAGRDAFAVYFDAIGAYRRFNSFGGDGDDGAFAVAMTNDDNEIITGAFQGTIYSGLNLTSAGDYDAFVVGPGWATSLGGAQQDLGAGLAITPAGEVLVTGSFTGHAAAGALTLDSAGGADGFLARLDALGAPLSVRSLGGRGDDYAFAVAAAGADALVAGCFSASMRLGSATLHSAGGFDAFLAGLPPSVLPPPRWRFGGPQDDHAWTVSRGRAGEVLVGGDFRGAAAFPDQTLRSTGAADGFLLRVPGATPAADACIDIDECADNNGGCSPYATCQNTPEYRTCTCKPGAVGDGETCTLTSGLTVKISTPSWPCPLGRQPVDGTILSDPPGLRCDRFAPATCTAPFAPGTAVRLFAQTGPTTVLSSLSVGGTPCPSGECLVTIDGTIAQASAVLAIPAYFQVLAQSGFGGGGVTLTPPGQYFVAYSSPLSVCVPTVRGTPFTAQASWPPNRHLWSFTCTGDSCTCAGALCSGTANGPILISETIGL